MPLRNLGGFSIDFISWSLTGSLVEAGVSFGTGPLYAIDASMPNDLGSVDHQIAFLRHAM